MELRATKPRMMRFGRITARVTAAGFLLIWPGAEAAHAQALDGAAIVRHIDTTTQTRYETIAGYTVREHYSVFRGADQTHPAAEMTVETTYKKGAGKNYSVVSESGSAVIRRFGLRPLLDDEKTINTPGMVEKSWLVSANYDMRLKSGDTRMVDGHTCVGVSISPRRKAPNLIEGTLWVDVKDGSVVEVEGFPSKSPSIFAGRTHMERHYQIMSGFGMATHARAESDGGLLGRTVVTIDYQDYKIDLRPSAATN